MFMEWMSKMSKNYWLAKNIMRQDAIIANCQIFRIINYSCKLNIQFILYETILYLDFPPGLAYELKNYTDTVSAIRDGGIR